MSLTTLNSHATQSGYLQPEFLQKGDTVKVYQASVVQSLSAFEELAPEWMALLQACGEDNLSLDHPWLMTYLKYFPPVQLFVITIRNGEGELVAAAPLKIGRISKGVFSRFLRSLEFIGGNAPCVYDHIQFLLRPGEDIHEIARLMAQQILKYKARWDLLDLRFVSESYALQTLHGFLEPHVFKQTFDDRDAMFTLDFPDDAADGDACIGDKSLRKNLSRHRKRILKDFGGKDATLVIQPPDDESDRKLDAFFDDLTAYWVGRGVRIDLMRYPALRPFYKTLHRFYPPDAATGVARVELSYLKAGETVLSCNLGFWRKGRFLGHLFTYQPEYRKYAPGLLHIQEVIRHVFRHGGGQLDFGRGDESYKTEWANSQMPIYSLLTVQSPVTCLRLKMDEVILKVYRTLKERRRQSQASNEQQVDTVTD